MAPLEVAFFSLVAGGKVLGTIDSENRFIAGLLYTMALVLIFTSGQTWLSWYWIVGTMPFFFRSYFRTLSPVRANKSVVGVEDDPMTYKRDWQDVMIVSNVIFLVAAAVAYNFKQGHLAFICVGNFWSSCIYHRERETAWYNYDSVFAQFQGFLLFWVLYCSAPSTATMIERVDTYVAYDGFSSSIEAFIGGFLSPFTDDRGYKSGLELGVMIDEFTVCQRSEEYFWVMLLAIPLGMVLLEAGGENANVEAALNPNAGKSSGKLQLPPGVCFCARNVNPRYELYHPMWHMLALFGPLMCTIYFSTHCDEESHVLGSTQVVSSSYLPFVETLELPIVPTMLIVISVLNSLQLNVTGIKPPE